MCSPFDPIDFQKREWVPDSGWPITRKDLDPFYAKANKVLKLGPYNYEYDYWNNELPNLNPFPLDNKVVWNKMWQFSLARYGELYRKEIVEARNIHLYTYANAVDIKTNDSISQVKELIVKNHAEKTHTVKARQFVMACGAIQNARMLLAANSQNRKGLGNDNDLVGSISRNTWRWLRQNYGWQNLSPLICIHGNTAYQRPAPNWLSPPKFRPGKKY